MDEAEACQLRGSLAAVARIAHGTTSLAPFYCAAPPRLPHSKLRFDELRLPDDEPVSPNRNNCKATLSVVKEEIKRRDVPSYADFIPLRRFLRRPWSKRHRPPAEVLLRRAHDSRPRSYSPFGVGYRRNSSNRPSSFRRLDTRHCGAATKPLLGSVWF